jgi:tetratricopeptide (TPR) repeat protein
LIEGNSYSEALTELSQALELDPNSPVVHFNMGVAFHGLQQLDQAASSYRLAIENRKSLSDPSEVLFKAYFNLGVIEAGKKNVDLALQNYQEALRYSPDSKETKINIELLMQQQQQDEQQQKQDQEKKDQQEQQDPKDQKDQSEQKNEQKNEQDQKDQKDQKEKKDEGKGEKPDQKEKDKPEEKPEEKKPGEYEKPQPQEFKSEDLSKSDVNKILDEIRQQEQKIRQDFQRKESKEKPRDKSW